MANNRKFRNRSWCMLEPGILESEAYKDLSGKAAVTCLLRFHQKAFRKNQKGRKRGMKDMVITNNGEIIFTYGEAKELGIRSSKTFHKAIRELVEDKGFIDISETGNWYERKPSKYAISQRWGEYGTPDYKKVTIKRGLPEGLGFQQKNKTRCTGVKSTHCTGVK